MSGELKGVRNLFRSTSTILGYLARYIHRVAISNQRLVSIDQGSVTFDYKDHAHGNRWQSMRLPAEEFLRRLSQTPLAARLHARPLVWLLGQLPSPRVLELIACTYGPRPFDTS